MACTLALPQAGGSQVFDRPPFLLVCTNRAHTAQSRAETAK